MEYFWGCYGNLVTLVLVQEERLLEQTMHEHTFVLQIHQYYTTPNLAALHYASLVHLITPHTNHTS